MEVTLRDIKDETSPLRKFLFDDVPLLGDVVEFYKQSNGMMKRNILRCIFSEKIYFDENKDATIVYTPPVETILLISNSLNSYKRKKEVNYDLFSHFARVIEESCNYRPLSEYVIFHRTWFSSVKP